MSVSPRASVHGDTVNRRHRNSSLGTCLVHLKTSVHRKVPQSIGAMADCPLRFPAFHCRAGSRGIARSAPVIRPQYWGNFARCGGSSVFRQRLPRAAGCGGSNVAGSHVRGLWRLTASSKLVGTTREDPGTPCDSSACFAVDDEVHSRPRVTGVREQRSRGVERVVAGLEGDDLRRPQAVTGHEVRYRPCLRPVEGTGRRKRPLPSTSTTMVATATRLGGALALLLFR